PRDLRGEALLWSPAAGRPLLAWSAAAFAAAPAVARSLLLVSPARLAEATALIAAAGWRRHMQPLAAEATAVTEAQTTLVAILAALGTSACELVLHDMARPPVPPELIAAVPGAARAAGVAGATSP